MTMRQLRRAAYDREQGRCLITGLPLGDPDGDSWNLHHRVPGGMGGSRWNRDRLDNVIAILARVHNPGPGTVHGSPSWSMPRGYLLPARERDPGSFPLLHFRLGWTFLDDAGGYVPLT